MRDAWLDLVLGSACLGCGTPGRPLCAGCDAGLARVPVPVRPDPCPPGLAPAYAVGPYADPLRRLVLAHKERGLHALAAPLGRLLAASVEAVLADLADAAGPAQVYPAQVYPVLVPVPSRPWVVRARGSDPLLRVVRAAARELPGRRAAGVLPLLRQRGRVRDQAGLDAGERAANLHEALAARPAALRRLARTGRPVVAVVCDDVLTTGATAREAQRALAAVGVPVAGIAVIAATTRLRGTESGSSLPLFEDGG